MNIDALETPTADIDSTSQLVRKKINPKTRSNNTANVLERKNNSRDSRLFSRRGRGGRRNERKDIERRDDSNSRYNVEQSQSYHSHYQPQNEIIDENEDNVEGTTGRDTTI